LRSDSKLEMLLFMLCADEEEMAFKVFEMYCSVELQTGQSSLSSRKSTLRFVIAEYAVVKVRYSAY
jgi:hypothetical protein